MKQPLYFQQARTWANDEWVRLIASRNRYRLAFLVSLGIAGCLSLSLCAVAPSIRTQLVIVHQGESGATWISTAKPGQTIQPDWLRTKAEIAHYVTMRESYDPLLNQHLQANVELLSSHKTFNQYQLSNSRPTAAKQFIGSKGYRSITINAILPLSNHDKKHRQVHLAQVNFTTVDHFFGASTPQKTAYSALIAWRYRGVPTTPYAQLHNWDGFTVIKYVKQPLIIS